MRRVVSINSDTGAAPSGARTAVGRPPSMPHALYVRLSVAARFAPRGRLYRTHDRLGWLDVRSRDRILWVELLLWIVLGVVLAVAEIFTTTLFLIMFSAGAFAAAIAAGLGAPVLAQVLIFTVVSALTVAVARPTIRRHLASPTESGDSAVRGRCDRGLHGGGAGSGRRGARSRQDRRRGLVGTLLRHHSDVRPGRPGPGHTGPGRHGPGLAGPTYDSGPAAGARRRVIDGWPLDPDRRNRAAHGGDPGQGGADRAAAAAGRRRAARQVQAHPQPRPEPAGSVRRRGPHQGGHARAGGQLPAAAGDHLRQPGRVDRHGALLQGGRLGPGDVRDLQLPPGDRAAHRHHAA